MHRSAVKNTTTVMYITY